MVETKYGWEAGNMHNGTLKVFMTSYLLTKVTDYQADYCSGKIFQSWGNYAIEIGSSFPSQLLHQFKIRHFGKVYKIGVEKSLLKEIPLPTVFMLGRL